MQFNMNIKLEIHIENFYKNFRDEFKKEMGYHGEQIFDMLNPKRDTKFHLDIEYYNILFSREILYICRGVDENDNVIFEGAINKNIC